MPLGGLFSWEPVDFGLRSAMVREAEAGVVRARADEGLTRLAVQNAVGGAFLAVVSAQQALAAADADVQRREVLARAAHTLADNQLRPGAEASRADAELAAARTRAIQARQAVTLGQTTLARLLGITRRPGRRERDEAAGQRRARDAASRSGATASARAIRTSGRGPRARQRDGPDQDRSTAALSAVECLRARQRRKPGRRL